jgi:carboxypeptidase family protein/Big-like domain-containing protein
VVAIVAIAMTACGSSSSPSPTAPAPTPAPSPSTTAVAVTGSPASTDTFQLTATAQFSDGTSRDVTSAARWESSNALLATVSSTGLVAIRGTGEVELRATYQSVTGSMRLFVIQPPPPTKFTLSGLVREAGTVRFLSGARLLVATGPDAGAFAISDEGGLFTFPSLSPGVITLERSKDGYIVARLANLTISQNMTIDFTLYLTPPRDASGASATARCKDQSWSWAQTWADACTNNGGVAYGVCPGPLCY